MPLTMRGNVPNRAIFLSLLAIVTFLYLWSYGAPQSAPDFQSLRTGSWRNGSDPLELPHFDESTLTSWKPTKTSVYIAHPVDTVSSSNSETTKATFVYGQDDGQGAGSFDEQIGNYISNQPEIIVPSSAMPTPSRIWSGPSPMPQKEALEALGPAPLDQDKLTEMSPDHWPPYQDYKDRDYDPNRWHQLPLENGYFEHGIGELGESPPGETPSPTPYRPFPKYNSPQWQKHWKGEYKSCIGPRGVPIDESNDDAVWAYKGLPQGFPPPYIGSYEAIGLDHDVCFDRYGKMDAYGFSDEHEELADSTGQSFRPSKVNWNEVNWGKLQTDCYKANINRFKAVRGKEATEEPDEPETVYQPRTAVLVRTWESYDYTSNDREHLRSLVSELSLMSGGEYQVFLLVQVRDLDIPIATDPEVYKEVRKKSVPEEFENMAILWNEKMMQEMYPEVGENSVYWQQFQPVQWFAKKRPEFEHFWNWEMDARYTGHHYHFLDRLGSFARAQPRKYLWERNARFWMPSLHGSAWSDMFRWAEDVVPWFDSVWGAARTPDVPAVLGPEPPHTFMQDQYKWGVGEEADLITLLPLFDPQDTQWAYRDVMYHFGEGHRSPRRVYINTLGRYSRRLLDVMHEENIAGRSMASEMWPGTAALQHGLKAVYAPHPLYLSHQWPDWYADSAFNAGPAAKPGGGSDSVYNPDREHQFFAFSWYFLSDFPKVLYRRWLGIRTKDVEGVPMAGKEWEETHSRMCIPGILLHPVKNWDLYNGREDF